MTDRYGKIETGSVEYLYYWPGTRKRLIDPYAPFYAPFNLPFGQCDFSAMRLFCTYAGEAVRIGAPLTFCIHFVSRVGFED